MGEKAESGKKEGADNKKAADAGGKKDEGYIVLKMDVHCEGCAKKIRKLIKTIDGVDGVKIDNEANKVTVIGKADPGKVQERLAEKFKKKVDVISPQPKKAEGGGDKKSDDKPKAKEEKKKEEEKKEEPKVITVIFKIWMHCEGCINKMRKLTKKFKGVQEVSIDAAKDLVTVKGTMDAKTLQPYLKEKLRRDVEIVPAKKEEKKDDKKDDKKEEKKEEKKEGGGEKKKDEGRAQQQAEVNKMEYYGGGGYGYPVMGGTPSYWYGPPPHHTQGHAATFDYGSFPAQGQNVGYVQQFHAGYPPVPYHAPQMFSEENPNACSVM